MNKTFKDVEKTNEQENELLSNQKYTNMPKRKSTSPVKSAKKKVQKVTEESAPASDATQDFHKMKVPELKAALKKLGLKRSGKKADLLQRLLDAQKK